MGGVKLRVWNDDPFYQNEREINVHILKKVLEIRSLSADCLPSVCGVSASQLFGRSVANFLNPIWSRPI